MNAEATAGLLAFGDSITNAGGDLQAGVALQSWALWTARGLGLPYNPYAVDGATVRDVLDRQIPLFERVSAHPGARFAVGCLYIGTNDVRLPGWDPADFAADLDVGFAFLAARCDRVLTATLPASLGRPPDAGRIIAANTVITATATRHGVLVIDLGDFRARNWLMADHVHPTAFGQVALAQRALAVLAADGLPTRVDPAQLIMPGSSRAGRLHADATYVYRSTKERLAQSRRGAWVALRRRAAARRPR